MDIKFEKTVLQHLQTIAEEVKISEESQQIRLTDTFPDVKQVITGWGQTFISGKQWLADQIQVSGGIKVWVLYQGAEEDKLQCIESWLPFQVDFNIPHQERDGCIVARPFLRNVDVRTLSDRKIMVRVTVGMSVQALVAMEKHLSNCSSLPEDILILQRSYPMRLPVECGEKLINIEGPADIQINDYKILRCNIQPSLTESKIISDKLVMRGNAKLEVLLLDADGKIQKWQQEYPFSQFVQLDKEYDNHTSVDVFFGITELEIEKNETGAEIIQCGILAQFVIYETVSISVIEDAYSTKTTLDIERKQLELPSVLMETDQPLQAVSEMEKDSMHVIDVVGMMDELNMRQEGNQLLLTPTGMFQILYEDENGNLSCVHRVWSTEYRLDNEMKANVCASVKMDGDPKSVGSSLLQDLSLEVKCISNAAIPMIDEMRVGEEKTLDPNRPSIIICRIGDDGIWSLAKNTGSTVAAIMQANNLEQEPEEGQMLLVPVI